MKKCKMEMNEQGIINLEEIPKGVIIYLKFPIPNYGDKIWTEKFTSLDKREALIRLSGNLVNISIPWSNISAIEENVSYDDFKSRFEINE